jgi:hypothetical protein
MRTAPTLLAYVQSLPEILRQRLINISYDTLEGTWRLSYHYFGAHTVGVDETGEETPLTAMGYASVSLTSLVRWPSDELTTDDTDPIQALRTLQASGIKGHLDVAWVGDRLIAKCHAGSEVERWEWLTGVPPEPQQTIYGTYRGRRRRSPSDIGKSFISIGRAFPHEANDELRALGGYFRIDTWKVRRRDFAAALQIVTRHGGRISDEAMQIMGVEA